MILSNVDWFGTQCLQYMSAACMGCFSLSFFLERGRLGRVLSVMRGDRQVSSHKSLSILGHHLVSLVKFQQYSSHKASRDAKLSED
jgi:hypothetical protein